MRRAGQPSSWLQRLAGATRRPASRVCVCCGGLRGRGRTRVTSRPPHRSGHEAFPHTAPTSGPYVPSEHNDTHAAIVGCMPAGAESGACGDGTHSPWPRPFAPPTPQQIVLPCSPASQLLWPRPTSHARTSSATTLRLPDADRRTRERTLNRRPDVGSPKFRRDPFARDVLFDPGRVDCTSLNGTTHVAFGS